MQSTSEETSITKGASPPKLYWWTGKRPRGRPSKARRPVVSGDMDTTSLILEAVAGLARRTPGGGFTLRGLIGEVDWILQHRHMAFIGQTSDVQDYASDAERIVRGRFGDLLRSGVFTRVCPVPRLRRGRPPKEVRVASLDPRQNIRAKIDRRLGLSEPGRKRPTERKNAATETSESRR